MKEVIKKIEAAQKIAIFCHINPDGDAIGSSLAISGILKNMGKSTQIFLSNKPTVFEFLPGYDQTITEFKEDNFDLIIILDCGDIKRVTPFYEENTKFFLSTPIIVIDHHIPPKNGFGIDNNKLTILVDENNSSTCGHIFQIFYKSLKQYFNKDIATNLFFGIYTDTGGFIHEEDTKSVFNTCIRLLELGADKQLIINEFVKRKTLQETKFLGKIINRAKLKGDILHTYYDSDELEKYGVKNTTKLGYSTLSKIDGPKALVIAKKDGDKIRFGMRSKGNYNVQKIADKFGGGGHKYAAGFSVTLEKGIDYKLQIQNIVKKINTLL